MTPAAAAKAYAFEPMRAAAFSVCCGGDTVELDIPPVLKAVAEPLYEGTGAMLAEAAGGVRKLASLGSDVSMAAEELSVAYAVSTTRSTVR